jgi:predicted SnoaL-like aldol condensation-catalyzing enzyme
MAHDLEANKQAAIAFFQRGFNEHDAETAVSTYMAEPYVQHNPQAADGMEASKAAIGGLVSQFPDAVITPRRVVAEGDLVALHNHLVLVPGTPGLATVDIFRFNDDGKIVEHWDVIQEIPAEAANDNTMF